MLSNELAPAVRGRAYALGAFRHPNYRLYLFGLAVSQIGTWMQYVAEGLLVYDLTHAPLSLGLLGFLPMIPLAPLMLVSGALADRLPRRQLLLAVQLGSVVPPLVLAALTWAGIVQVWHIVAVEVVMQALAALDMPARQALVADTVSPEDIDTAVAMGASAINLARVVGPAVGGLLAAWAGTATCFAVNGLSFLAAAWALWRLRLPPQQIRARPPSITAHLTGGLVYLVRERLLFAVLALAVAAGLFVMPYQRFLPVLALDILRSGEVGVGTLNALAGVGAVLGALALVWLTKSWPNQRGRLALGFGLVLPAVAAGLALSRVFWLSCLMVALLGAGVVAVRSLAFTLAQVHVPDDLRGRAMGLLVLLSVSAIRVGELGVGLLAGYTGTAGALLVGAAGCLVSVVAVGIALPALRRAT